MKTITISVPDHIDLSTATVVINHEVESVNGETKVDFVVEPAAMKEWIEELEAKAKKDFGVDYNDGK